MAIGDNLTRSGRLTDMTLAIIGGTGAVNLLDPIGQRIVETPYGEPSAPLTRVRLGKGEAWFLARHGSPHRIAPHRVNYRANIDALRQQGVDRIIAVNAVGSIAPDLEPGSLVVPDQLIDYTWGRESSFANDADRPLVHIEFADPFTPSLRDALLETADAVGMTVHAGGCCAVTQGPRLETAAEVRRLAADGCTLVGMTSLPEAALAREAGLDYVSLCVVANPAAGLSHEPISMAEIEAVLGRAMADANRLLQAFGDRQFM